MNQKQDFCILFSWSQEAESGGEGDDVTGTDPSYNTDLLQKSKPEEQEDEGQRMQKTHCSIACESCSNQALASSYSGEFTMHDVTLRCGV